jgi:hypothetical protein
MIRAMAAQGDYVIPEYRGADAGANGSSGTIPSGFFVACGIAATLALLLAMLGLLLYRAITQRAPEKALIVQGDDRWAGVSIGIEGGTLPAPMISTLDKSNKYFVSFFLDPGTYTFYVRHGTTYIQPPMTIAVGKDVDTMGLDLVHSNLTPPAVEPATRPSTRPLR